jgi:hypothetical protein
MDELQQPYLSYYEVQLRSIPSSDVLRKRFFQSLVYTTIAYCTVRLLWSGIGTDIGISIDIDIGLSIGISIGSSIGIGISIRRFCRV